MILELLDFTCDLLGLRDYYQALVLLFLMTLYIIGVICLITNVMRDKQAALKALRKTDRSAYLQYKKRQRTRQLVIIYLILSPFILLIKGYRATLKGRRKHV